MVVRLNTHIPSKTIQKQRRKCNTKTHTHTNIAFENINKRYMHHI